MRRARSWARKRSRAYWKWVNGELHTIEKAIALEELDGATYDPTLWKKNASLTKKVKTRVLILWKIF